jgi:hypothetical protein
MCQVGKDLYQYILVYTSDYGFTSSSTDRHLEKSNFKFYNATLIPDVNPPAPAVTALVGCQDYKFYLHMYALGEELDYEALKTATHAKLCAWLVQRHNYTPSAVKEVIEATFAPPGDASRMCKDENGALQQLVVASVLSHEGKFWTETQRKEFTDSIQAPAYAPFRNAYDIIKEENKDLLKASTVAKALAEKREAVNAQRQKQKGTAGTSLGSGGNGSALRKPRSPTKFKKRHEAKRMGNEPKSGGGEDVEMEVD